MRVLLIEDNRKLVSALKIFFQNKGIEIISAFNRELGREKIEAEYFDVIVSDLKLPDGNGLQLLQLAVEKGVPFVVITAYGTIETAVEAIKKGAYNFIQKPVDPEYLELIIKRAYKEKQTELGYMALKELEEIEIIGKSPSFLQALEKAKRAAQTDISVLLLGETGVGKEVFARAIHLLSKRRKGPFVPINCASLPENLLESELFGYEKGAFTGAVKTKQGRIEFAKGGTLFLDEIGEMSPSLQAKLLRVLEEKKFERLGGVASIQVDIRLVTATNKDIESLTEEGKFRSDLYYRISGFPIKIPPLRERKQDIIPLAEHFLSKMARSYGGQTPLLTEKARKKLESYSWPGNVRELKNVIERAFILKRGRYITEREIVLKERKEILDISGTLKEALKRVKDRVEKEKIKQTLDAFNGDITKASKVLGISPKTLYSKMKKYGLK